MCRRFPMKISFVLPPKKVPRAGEARGPSWGGKTANSKRSPFLPEAEADQSADRIVELIERAVGRQAVCGIHERWRLVSEIDHIDISGQPLGPEVATIEVVRHMHVERDVRRNVLE